MRFVKFHDQLRFAINFFIVRRPADHGSSLKLNLNLLKRTVLLAQIHAIDYLSMVIGYQHRVYKSIFYAIRLSMILSLYLQLHYRLLLQCLAFKIHKTNKQTLQARSRKLFFKLSYSLNLNKVGLLFYQIILLVLRKKQVLQAQLAMLEKVRVTFDIFSQAIINIKA